MRIGRDEDSDELSLPRDPLDEGSFTQSIYKHPQTYVAYISSCVATLPCKTSVS